MRTDDRADPAVQKELADGEQASDELKEHLQRAHRVVDKYRRILSQAAAEERRRDRRN